MPEEAAVLEPEQWIKPRHHIDNLQVLIKWKGQLPSQSSWEEAELIKQLYPTFHLEDKLLVPG
jgi:hypothetical protein